MKKEVMIEIPILKDIKELAIFVVQFWLSPLVIYLKKKGKIADTVNMLRFIDAHDKEGNAKLFSKAEIRRAEKKCFKYITKAIAEYGFSVYSESYGMGDFFEQVFANKIHSREFSVPELFMSYFDSKEKYAGSYALSEKRIGIEKRARLLQEYPGGAVLCIRTRGEDWRIIALLNL